jgi:hypothetical protein
MTKELIFSIVRCFILQCAFPRQEVLEDTDLRQLTGGQIIRIIGNIECAWDLHIPDNAVKHFETPQHIVDWLNANANPPDPDRDRFWSGGRYKQR